MKISRGLVRACSLGLCLFLTSSVALYAAQDEQFWPQWRGPLCTGVAPLANPPLNWSETNHIKWKAAIAGEGDSTPIVWGDRVFVLSAVPVAPAEAGNNSTGPNGTFRFTTWCL